MLVKTYKTDPDHDPFALSDIGKVTCFAFDFVHNSLDLICGGTVFWFLKDTAQCFNRLESGWALFTFFNN